MRLRHLMFSSRLKHVPAATDLLLHFGYWSTTDQALTLCGRPLVACRRWIRTGRDS